ncbi:uncharacterized protein C8R40DRAFT_656751 [Lentinula edodes]|uniref:uncharacterized protein n=1 Tax=Lentinula edodes TaxID=5353 RepID=UPI001E8E68F6|nr:uncharacterized protein C8R40DRAFT_656751 [Lentinula edodes]KAH7870156.1 hypothetical protein C8R40DRAFT_656751 [Lentinula edodes]
MSSLNLVQFFLVAFYMVEAQRLAGSLQPQMEKLIKDEISLPLWEPAFNVPNLEVPQKHKDFIHSLKIPRARAPHDHLPDMLLYELGRFQQDEHLKARLRGLFTKHSNHKIFVNTSGAGKTRLVLEHLCSNWGLYFSCHNDSHVGSKDVPSAMSNIRQALFGSTLPHAPSLLVTSADIAVHARHTGKMFKKVKSSVKPLKKINSLLAPSFLSHYSLGCLSSSNTSLPFRRQKKI